MASKVILTEEKISFGEMFSVAIVSWMGSFLEWLDFYIYAILAKLIAKIFFPATDPIASLLASFGALAVGFFFRPLGALLFGKIGDQFGRKISFVITVLVMMIGTFGIALLPSYEDWGILASFCIFILRIFQGLALGGSYGAAITYLGEYTPEHRRGLILGGLFVSCPAGMAAAGTLAYLLQGYFGMEAFTNYGWRWCFGIGGLIIGIIAVIILFLYKETPVFAALKKLRKVTSSPIKELFTNKQYLSLFLLVWIGVIGAHGPIWYTNMLYVSYFMQHHGISLGESSRILANAIYLSVWTYLFFGWLSDKIGRRPVLLAGIFLNALAFPVVFKVMEGYLNPPNFTVLFLLTLFLTCFNGVAYSGAMPAYLIELYPAKIRTTAVGFTYNMGYAFTGGITPFAITFLYRLIGNLYIAIIIWSTLIPCIMALYYLLKGFETKGTRIWEELSSGKLASTSLLIPPDMPVSEVIHKMYTEGHKFGVIVSDTFQYLGFIERKKLLKSAVEGTFTNLPIERVMLDVPSINKKVKAIEGITIMYQLGLEGIAVVDDNNKVIGVLELNKLTEEYQ